MSFVKVLDIPDDKNVYIIGDIHGNYGFYQRTLLELGITDDDVVISVGDLIDRGQYNEKMLQEFLDKPNRYMVLGNHEDMMIRGLTDKRWYDTWLYNGGDKTLEELGSDNVLHYCELLSDVPYIIELNHRGYKLGISHAAIPNFSNITHWEEIKRFAEENEEYRQYLLWDRDAIDFAMHDWEIPQEQKLKRVIEGVNYVIHGHTGVPNKFQFGNRVWIDTQFRANKFTVAYMDTTEGVMKFKSVIADEWGTDNGYRIEEQ